MGSEQLSTDPAPAPSPWPHTSLPGCRVSASMHLILDAPLPATGLPLSFSRCWVLGGNGLALQLCMHPGSIRSLKSRTQDVDGTGQDSSVTFPRAYSGLAGVPAVLSWGPDSSQGSLCLGALSSGLATPMLPPGGPSSPARPCHWPCCSLPSISPNPDSLIYHLLVSLHVGSAGDLVRLVSPPVTVVPRAWAGRAPTHHLLGNRRGE